MVKLIVDQPPGVKLTVDPPAGDSVGGVAKSVTTGLRSGLEGLAGAGGDLVNWEKRKAAQLAEMMGASPETVQAIATYGDQPTRGPGIMDTAAVQGGTNAAVGALPAGAGAAVQDITQHKAQGPIERGAETVGNFLPNAIGPGGPLAAAARVAIPAAATEGAGYAAQQLAPEYEDAARMVAGLISGGVAARAGSFASRRAALKMVGTDPKSVARVQQLLLEQGMSAEDAAAAVKQLGPEGMMLDTGPNVRQEAQQIQARGGEGRGLLDKPLREREGRVNERLGTDVEAAVGPRLQRGDILSGLKDRAAALSPEYEAAHRAQVKPVETTGIVDAIDTDLAKVKSPEVVNALERIKRSLGLRGTDQLDPSTEGLHEARKAIDNELRDHQGRPRDLGGQTAATLQRYRGMIDEALGDAGPIKAVDAKRAQVGKEERAFQQGEEIYENPRGAPSEVEFQQVYDQMSPGEQARVLDGLNVETYRQIGINANDRTKLQQLLKGDGKWNQQKVATVVGDDKAQALMDALKREKVFQESYQKIVQGPKTAETVRGGKRGFGTAVRDAIPEVAVGGMVGGPGVAGGVAASHLRRYAGEAMRSKPGAGDAGVAKLLASNRPDDLVEAVKLMSSRGSALPPAVLSALLARQRDVSERKDQR